MFDDLSVVSEATFVIALGTFLVASGLILTAARHPDIRPEHRALIELLVFALWLLTLTSLISSSAFLWVAPDAEAPAEGEATVNVVRLFQLGLRLAALVLLLGVLEFMRRRWKGGR